MEIFEEKLSGDYGYDHGVPRQFIIINGEKYYFDQEYVYELYSLKDAEKDAFVDEVLERDGVSTVRYDAQKEEKKWKNFGLLKNGNMVVRQSTGRNAVGIVDQHGNIVAPFNYSGIKQIRKSNGEVVHDDFLIAESINGEVPEYGYMKDCYSPYKGIITIDGFELYPIDETKLDCVEYDEQNDLIRCNNYENWKGLMNARGYSGFDEDSITITEEQLKNYISRKVK